MTGKAQAALSKGLYTFRCHLVKGTVPSLASAEELSAEEGCLLLPQNMIPEVKEIDGLFYLLSSKS